VHFTHIVFNCRYQVEDADVAVFSLKLLLELSHLVDAAVSAQQDDVEGLCSAV
jgi:hypothetical protein